MFKHPHLADPEVTLQRTRVALSMYVNVLHDSTLQGVQRDSVELQCRFLTNRVLRLRREVLDRKIHELCVHSRNLKTVDANLCVNMPEPLLTDQKHRRIALIHRIEKLKREVRYYAEMEVTLEKTN